MFYSAQRERTGEFYMYECERLFGVERGLLEAGHRWQAGPRSPSTFVPSRFTGQSIIGMRKLLQEHVGIS